MVMNIKHTFILLLAILACSCTKDTDEVGAPILFSIDGGLDVELTKSVINTDNLGSNIIKVYAEKDAVAMTDANSAVISKPNVYWNYINDAKWDDGHSYSFQGYAYNITSNKFTNVSADGRTFTVTHSSNSIADTYDYVISRKVEVGTAESCNHPVVGLVFEHVLPSVEVYVTRSENIRTAKVTKITLSNLFSKATLKYSEKDDIWTTEIDGSNTASYSISNNTGYVVGTDKSSTSAIMSIISVPQVFDETTELSITYKVDERAKETDRENLVQHTQTFRLLDYVPEIRSGYRTILHVNIDTGIHLNAGIVKWKEVDFIEGTVLPPIDRPQADPPQSD